MFVACMIRVSHLCMISNVFCFFFEFLSLESISVLNDALSQIESQGSISMNSTNSRSVVSSAVDTVSTSVYQTCLNLAENLGHEHLLVISFYSSLLTAE